MHVNVHDEGQTGVKEVDGFVPTEEKIYAVSAILIILILRGARVIYTT